MSESDPEPTVTATQPPGVAYSLATAGGLGRLPVAPGTWGSLAGLALAWLFAGFNAPFVEFGPALRLQFFPLFGWMVLSAAGVWAAGLVERQSGTKDPQEVVVDEVSGQWLALLISPGMLSGGAGWKSYLAGLILFRAFDIAKPFPAGRAESLPGGWGIMADDWMAGAYAAACLWLAYGIGFS
jgi:phosphatidylglycerophosphatase A